jgi:hypothetical protein
MPARSWMVGTHMPSTSKSPAGPRCRAGMPLELEVVLEAGATPS